MKLSICNELFEAWPLEKVFSYVSRLGYHGVEIAPFTLTEDVRSLGPRERRRLRELAESHGLEIVGLHWLLVKPEGLHILGPSRETINATLEYMRALIDFSADLGGKVLVFGSPRQRNVPPGMSREEAWRRALDFFSNVAEYAEERGQIVAIEPLARHLTNFINTVDEAVKLVEEVGSPGLRLILDVYSMTDEGRPYGEIIRRGGRYLVHFHANDTNKLGPGFGDADYIEILNALREVGYRGFLSVEVFDTSPGAERIASESIGNLKKFGRMVGLEF